jgi:hypothetical protein
MLVDPSLIKLAYGCTYKSVFSGGISADLHSKCRLFFHCFLTLKKVESNCEQELILPSQVIPEKSEDEDERGP